MEKKSRAPQPQRTRKNRESSRSDPTSAPHCEVADTVTHREVQLPGAATLPEEEKPNTRRKKIREPGRSGARHALEKAQLPGVATLPEEENPGTSKNFSPGRG